MQLKSAESHSSSTSVLYSVSSKYTATRAWTRDTYSTEIPTLPQHNTSVRVLVCFLRVYETLGMPYFQNYKILPITQAELGTCQSKRKVNTGTDLLARVEELQLSLALVPISVVHAFLYPAVQLILHFPFTIQNKAVPLAVCFREGCEELQGPRDGSLLTDQFLLYHIMVNSFPPLIPKRQHKPLCSSSTGSQTVVLSPAGNPGLSSLGEARRAAKQKGVLPFKLKYPRGQ